MGKMKELFEQLRERQIDEYADDAYWYEKWIKEGGR